MQVSTSIEINQSIEAVWQAVTNIEQSADMVSSINRIEVLEKPDTGFVGFKWKETRTMFGKEATEVMWVTESVENQYYQTRAESHGSIYISTISLESKEDKTLLTMSFQGEAQSIIAKILSALMSFMIKGSIEKELNKDLLDIKRYLEKNESTPVNT